MNDLPTAPDDEELRRLIRPLLEALVGPEGADELEAFSSDWAGILAAPATHRYDRDALVAEIIKRARPELAERAARSMDSLLAQHQAMRAFRAQEDQQLLAGPLGVELRAFLELAKAKLGAGEFRKLVDPVFRLTDADLFAVGTGTILMDPNSGLEVWADAALRQHRHTAERLYKPLLQAVLRLTRALRGDTTTPVPSEVGKVMAQCTDLWKSKNTVGPWPASFVDKRWSIARNSDGHCNTEIDVGAGIVTVVNHGTKVDRVPYTRTELGEMIASLSFACVVAWTAFRVVAPYPAPEDLAM